MDLRWLLISDRWKDCTFIVQAPGRQCSLSCWSPAWKMVLKWQFINNTEKETLHMHCSGQLEHGVHWVSRVSLERWSWNGHLFVTQGKAQHVYCSGLPRDRDLRVSRVLHGRWVGKKLICVYYSAVLKLRGLWVNRVFEMAIHWWHWERHKFIVQVSQERELLG